MKQRLLHLDAIKGLAILLVIMGHIHIFAARAEHPMYSYFMAFIKAVHMPLFFLIAGYFSQRPVSTLPQLGRYLKDKTIRLITPALLFLGLLTLWNRGTIDLSPKELLETHYWFTPALFIYFLVFLLQRWGIDQIVERLGAKASKALELGLHGAATIALCYTLTELPLYRSSLCSLDLERLRVTMACLYPYVVIGFLIGRLELLPKLQSHIAGGISFVLLLFSLGILRYYSYNTPYLSYGLWHNDRLMALSFFAFLVYTFGLMTEGSSKVGKAFVFLGNWSLPIYLVHYFFIPILPPLDTLLPALEPSARLPLELLLYFAGALVTLLPTLAVIYCLKFNPYLDFLLFGEKERLKKG